MFLWYAILIIILQYSSGGPIIAVQVENEYGSYADDTEYKARLVKVFIFLIIVYM